jgi:predicted enzyme related to lactoylglutathione lyase
MKAEPGLPPGSPLERAWRVPIVITRGRCIAARDSAMTATRAGREASTDVHYASRAAGFPKTMIDANTMHNRAVWFDIPVVDLDRAEKFYRAVLAIRVARESAGGHALGVLEHDGGNGGCLIPNPAAVSATGGILVYFNVDGRIRDAIRQVERYGGKVLEPLQGIPPHGYRAVVNDSEGNRIALHSAIDD